MIGPHENRELELMLSGHKPLSMFVEPLDAEYEYFSEAEFDTLVSEGRLRKHVSLETIPAPDDQAQRVRRVIYALPDEEWRIKALLLVLKIYDSLGPGWRPDLERIIGSLLGYERSDIEEFIELHRSVS